MSHDIEDWYLAHPRIDYAAPLIGTAIVYLLLTAGNLAVQDATTTLIATASSALAALSMASCVFVCTLTYQSMHPKIVTARRHHSEVARKNWMAIIGGTFVAALLPVLSLFFIGVSARIALVVAAASLGLVAVRFARSMLWLSLMLFASDQPHNDANHPQRVLRPTA